MPLQKLLCRHKNQFYWMQIIFLYVTKCLWMPQYVKKKFGLAQKIGPAQNILEPIKGQGISSLFYTIIQLPTHCEVEISLLSILSLHFKPWRSSVLYLCPVRDIKNWILQSSNSQILKFRVLQNAFKIKKQGLKYTYSLPIRNSDKS